MHSARLPAVGTLRAHEVSRLRSCFPNRNFHAVLPVAFNVCHQSAVYQRGVAAGADEARGQKLPVLGSVAIYDAKGVGCQASDNPQVPFEC
ncbi:MAG: hypothetical protein HYR77_05840 [Ignavibacteria bacterium]|nr:hypothetical protein [Ignavibacteria bacterium]